MFVPTRRGANKSERMARNAREEIILDMRIYKNVCAAGIGKKQRALVYINEKNNNRED
jgi:hypothetical protein